MKKILPYILMVLIFANMFAPLGVGIKNNSIVLQKNILSADNCKIVSASFDPHGMQPANFMKGTTRPRIVLNINTEGCKNSNRRVSLVLYEIDGALNPNDAVLATDSFNITKDQVVFAFYPGEVQCEEDGDTPKPDVPNCKIMFNITINTLVTNATPSINDVVKRESTSDEEISYKCALGTCNKNLGWQYAFDDQAQNSTVTGEQSITNALENTKAQAQKEMQAACAAFEAKPGDVSLKNKCDEARTNLQKTQQDLNIRNNIDDSDPLPECSLNPFWSGSGTVVGCVAQVIYYVLFIPTSYLFALTGKFFDSTFAYSVQDTSYRSGFVLEGWKIVRDFVNMFFIFVLLYIAFKTILGLGASKTKEMIINVVIIGIMINFSLFATQVIIDASNILARVFYNSNAIKITKKGANCIANPDEKYCIDLGQKIAEVGPNGEIPLSAALVNKINPQDLIINGRKSVRINDEVTKDSRTAEDTKNGIGVGAFILITLLSIAVNVIGIIVFLSVGLIFISRVVGLWIYMILAPFAFFSYTVPSMQTLDMVGWKKWWPEVLSLSFLAPIFIFFLYLILKFLESGLDIIGTYATKSGTEFVLTIIIPFAFIMILLMKAKDIAKKMSGELGQSITGGVAAAGGLALGGAALGAAFAGRKLIGGTSRYLQNDRARTDDSKIGSNIKKNFQGVKGLGKWTGVGYLGAGVKSIGSIGKGLQANLARGIGAIPTGKGKNIRTSLQDSAHDVEHTDHARTEMDSLADKAHLKGRDLTKLTGEEEKTLEKIYTKEKKSAVEADLNKNLVTTHPTTGAGVEGRDGYKAANRESAKNAYLSSRGIPITTPTTKIDDKNIENMLESEFNIKLKAAVDVKVQDDYKELKKVSEKEINPLARFAANAPKKSFDIRDTSKTKADSREGMFTKVSAGLIAGIAMGVRTGLKGSGINHGSGQGDFLKDIGHTISEAIKSTSVNVKIEKSDGHTGSDAHAGGGH